MSPVKKASAVDSLRRATAPAPATGDPADSWHGKRVSQMTDAEIQAMAGAKPKPVRITLDLSPDDYAALNQWLGSAGAEVGAPVSKAQALRAMIKAVSLDSAVGLVVTDLLRRDRAT